MDARERQSSAPTLCMAAAVTALFGAVPLFAQAQPGSTRAFITFNGGFQAATSSFSESVAFPETGVVYQETLSGAAAQEQARFESDYRFENAPLFDVSAGVRVAPYFALGVGVSHFMIEETASVSAHAPHPFFVNRDRFISGASPPLARRESAVHLQALVVVPVSRSFTVTGFGGPTFFDVEQQLVTDVNFTHAYPYDTATFSSAVTASPESADSIGFNIGADIAFYFTGNVGIGWLTRYSRATVELPSASGGTVDVEAGGLHTAVGLRLRF